MILEVLPVGPLQCNCVILGDPDTRNAIVIDPGDEAARIRAVLEYHRLNVRWILQTHAHFDHVGAARPLAEQTGAPVALHPDDEPLYARLHEQYALFGMIPIADAAPIGHWLKDGEELSAGGVRLAVFHTPGHSPGSVCFHLGTPPPEAEPLLFSGDTLFAGSIGRTDLWGGSMEQILASIKNRLLALPDDTRVIPGHGPDTTIGEERRMNPFLQERGGYF